MGSDDETDIKSRDQFVSQVASNIENSFGDGNNEAYIFGLSGKWGEGKTTFLDSLEKQLPNNVRIVRVNPWKYANDKISFLRAFLKAINDVAPYSPILEDEGRSPNRVTQLWYSNRGWLRRLWRWAMGPIRGRKLRPLYDDVSKSRIHYPMLALALAGVAVVVALYNWVLGDDVKSFIIDNKWFITALMVPVVLAAGQALIISQKSHHALTTLDSFDDLVARIEKSFHFHCYSLLRKRWPRKKATNILVFVDDLDRVTGTKAIEVLDNLRTFFDNGSFAFLVAGDHTVIERHLGKELLPDSQDTAQQKEEGRRFLKKIFNVYWRLPLPIAPEVDHFIESKILRQKTADGRTLLTRVGRILGNDDRRDVFKKQLAYYFENNFRNMLRFVERVVFSFDVIDTQLSNNAISDEKKTYFNDMKRHPLHVIRVLLLEEIANPLYEAALADTSIFKDMEKHAATGNFTYVDMKLEEYRKQNTISAEQQKLLKQLFMDTPRFFDETGVKVRSFTPYFFLSSDSSFGDERGLLPDEFVARLKDTEATGLKEIIENLGDDQMQKVIKKVLDEVSATPDKSAELLRSLFDGMLLVEQKFSVQNEVQQQIDPSVVSGAIAASDDGVIRNSLLIAYTSWLEHTDTSIAVPFEFAKVLEAEDIDSLAERGSLPLELSKLAVGWFVNTIRQDQATAVETFRKVLNTTHHEALSGYLAPAKDYLITAYLSGRDEDERSLAIELISDYLGRDTVDELRVKIKDQLLSDAQAMWGRSDEHVHHNLFTFDELDALLVESFVGINDYSHLRERLVFVSDKLRNKDTLWSLLIQEKMTLLTSSFLNFVGQQRYLAALYPNEDHAESIFEAIYEANKDQPQEYNALQHFNRSHFYFAQLNKVPNRRSIVARFTKSKSISPNTKSQLERITGSEWPRS